MSKMEYNTQHLSGGHLEESRMVLQKERQLARCPDRYLFGPRLSLSKVGLINAPTNSIDQEVGQDTKTEGD